MIGESISHYKILEKIGEGGMGVVYKAEDTKLKRMVALKFLPPELTRDPQAKARFVQEAQAAAALDHPNICAVFEIGEAKGATYIAMPYVKGQSLKEKIAAGPLSVEEALAIASQVAEGLREAHERGIIHRDIKPANIMLTEKGQAKIMDFGLAKLEAGVDLTRTMAVIGTAAYMSPEQARGEEVDHRTDIWSFGATLYEMLTGQKPFGQTHDQALLYSILNDTTEAVSRIRPEIPKPLDRVIQKSLEKEKSRRYQNMAELLKDLKSTGTPGLTVPKADKSIIVLPFEDISPGKDNEYFSDGLTEEIITDLSHAHDLLVISRSSAMTFKGTKKKIKEIAQEANVRYVLEGSVRKAGNNLRITAQLIDSSNDAHLWAEKYSGTLDDIFDIQEKVSRAIVNAIRLRLSPAEEQEISAKPFDDVLAYESYLKAMYGVNQQSREGLNKAEALLQNTLAEVGDHPLLLAGLAFVYFSYVNIGFGQEDSHRKAKEYARKAIDLDPDCTPAHSALGWILSQLDGNQKDAIQHYKLALAHNPNDSYTLVGLAMIYVMYVGKPEKAFLAIEKLRAIDPFNPWTPWIFGMAALYQGQYDRAAEAFGHAFKLDEENTFIQFFYSWSLAYLGRIQESFLIVDRAAEKTPDNAFTKLALIMKHAYQGEKGALERQLTSDLRQTYKRDAGYSYALGVMLARLGEWDEAIDWFENVGRLGCLNYPLLAEKDLWLVDIRKAPRFQKLMERVKYEWEHFDV
jgi:eukaryotic-like serine/threonine-protein kinase